MIRAAAKNYGRVAVVVDPDDYAGCSPSCARAALTAATRCALMRKAFAHTAAYDAAIAALPRGAPTRRDVPRRASRRSAFREGPGRCATARTRTRRPPSTAACQAPAGEPVGSASPRCCRARSSRTTTCSTSTRRWRWRRVPDGPAAVIIKHNTPCGVALGGRAGEAYRRRAPSTRCRAFGGIVAFNRQVDEALGTRAGRDLPRGVIAPRVLAPRRAELLAAKKNLRLLAAARGLARGRPPGARPRAAQRLAAACWSRTATRSSRRLDCKVVTQRAPTAAEQRGAALRLAGVQARQEQRHRLLRRRPACWPSAAGRRAASTR